MPSIVIRHNSNWYLHKQSRLPAKLLNCLPDPLSRRSRASTDGNNYCLWVGVTDVCQEAAIGGNEVRLLCRPEIVEVVTSDIYDYKVRGPTVEIPSWLGVCG